MSARPLRLIPAEPNPQQQWLALSAEISTLEARAKALRGRRQGIKARIMSSLSSWGMSDEQVTAALGRGR
jgi:hypothetical protein